MYTFFNIYNCRMASALLCDRIFRTKNSSHHISHIHIGSSSHAERPESYRGWSTSALHKACKSVHGGMLSGGLQKNMTYLSQRCLIISVGQLILVLKVGQSDN